MSSITARKATFLLTVLLFLSSFAVSVDPASALSSADFTRTLSKGAEGTDVTLLQKVLNTIGKTVAPVPESGSPGNETSYFGSLTASAVKAFQCEKGIVCEDDPESTGFGIVGPKTRAALNALISSLSSLFSGVTPRSQLAALDGAGSGLAGHWKFDEGSGTTAGDSSGNNNAGTLTNSPTWVSGADAKIGAGALQFDGVDDYVNLGSPSSLDNLASSTVAAWIYLTKGTGNKMIWGKGSRHRLWIVNRYVTYDFGYNTTNQRRNSAANVIPLNTWTHVAATKTSSNLGSTIRIYVNGAETSYPDSGTDGAGGINADGAYNAWIGQDIYGSLAFQGAIDDLRVYNRALSATEITDLYNSTGSSQPAPDTAAPTVPSGLSASALSSSQINLSWSASTDAVGVTGYRLYRNGSLLVTINSSLTTFSDTGLSASTQYSYTVSAYDAAGNQSAQSSSASAATQAQAPSTYTLTAQKSGTGQGAVTGGSINCGSTCSQTSNSGTSITLTASASSGSTFNGWSGGGCSGTGSCTVSLTANITITATFTQQTSTTPANCSAANVKCVPQEYATIQACANAAQAGDTCLVGQGVYNEFVNIPTSGTASAPIVFEGTRGPNGEYLTIIDPSTPASTGWVPAPEIGAGVYKKTGLPFETHAMTIDYKRVAFVWTLGDMYTLSISNVFSNSGLTTGAQLLAVPAGQVYQTPSWFGVSDVSFWDGLEALYASEGGVTYLRFRDGSDPNGRNIRVAPNRDYSETTDILWPAIKIYDKSYITLRNFMIRGAFAGVQIFYSNSHHNIIESNYFVAAYSGITVGGGAYENVMRNNDITGNYYGYSDPGAWGGNDSDHKYIMRKYLYLISKFFMGGSTEDEHGIKVIGAGRNNEIYGNLIFNGLGQGISLEDLTGWSAVTVGTDIHDNIIRNLSSHGFMIRPGNSAKIHNNQLIDANINLRFQSMNWVGETERVIYVYGNRLWLPNGVGDQIYTHFGSSSGSYYPTLWFYHNSFSGGRQGFMAGTNDMRNVRFANNVFSGAQYIGNAGLTFLTNANMLGFFDYNIITPPFMTYPTTADPAWFGSHNVRMQSPVWGTAIIPDFTLTAGSPAINAGLDLSRSFAINGVSYNALPGMSAGYFSGSAPDIGAYEYVSGGTPTPISGPCSATLNSCSSGTFSDTADSSTQYLWQCSGANGGTTASCSLPIPPAPINGSCGTTLNTCTAGTLSDTSDSSTQYLWQCTGSNGGTTASCSLPRPVALTISAQPANVTVTAGQTAAFSVTAAGTAPLTYQWQRNGTNISGATSVSYTTSETTAGDNGAAFRVIVTNSQGSVTSNSAALTVTAAQQTATTYYVDNQNPQANDSNSGTSDRPWRTIQKAANTAQAGDRVIVRRGTYNEFVTIANSGTADRPIVFEGERGINGEWLTIINPSTPASTGWVPAPEIGAGVYKKTDVPFETHELTIDHKRVAFVWTMGDMSESINQAYKNSGLTTGTQVLALASDAELASGFIYNYRTSSWAKIKFWDGIEALYGASGNTTYLRFRDGRNPNGMNIRVAPNNVGSLANSDMYYPAVKILDKSYITLRNFLIRGAFGGFRISGQNTHHNIVEGNHISNGYSQVLLATGANQNVIRDNVMTDNFFGYANPGAWGSGTDNQSLIRSNHYTVSKFLMGDSSSFSEAVRLVNAGSSNIINSNRISKGLGTGIGVRGLVNSPTQNTEIFNNIIENEPSVGIILSEGQTGTKVYDNTLSDNNINLRLHHFDYSTETDRKVYIYRNKLWLPSQISNQIYIHFYNSAPDTYRPEFWIYHNSFSGGSAALSVSGYAVGSGGIQNVRLLNNIFSGTQYANDGDIGLPFMTNRSMLGIFDYNIVTPPPLDYAASEPPAWFGSHNVRMQSPVWGTATIPDFTLTAGSPAINAGVDLSRPFTVDGVSYNVLPGMSAGYFSGSAPDIGAYEYVSGGIPTPINGSCGAALNSCTTGTFSDIADSSTQYLWSCAGANGGMTASCSLPIPPTPINGSCGMTLNSCTAGALSDTADSSTQYLWSCTGSNGDATASCSLPIPPAPINGSCGATLNSCTAGTLSDTADSSTQYLWQCAGSNGGTTASCSLPRPVAPTISAQPANQTVTSGQTATFSVTAAGTAPLTYQWQRNGTNITGATGASYTTPATTAGDNGAAFRVIVTNSQGSVTSNSAALTVSSAPATGTEWYVSPTGSASNSGSVTSPWNLQHALNGANGAIRPGHTVWLRGGTYHGTFASTLSGNANAPITVRSYPKEWAIISGGLRQSSGGYTTYQDFELTDQYKSVTKRVTGISGSAPRDIDTSGGFNGYVPGLKVINLVVHDAVSNGIGMWSSAPDSEIYGNIIYNNGWDALDRGHGHGIYTQNNTGTKTIHDNIIFGNLGNYGVHGYTEGGYLHNFDFQGNIVFKNIFLIGGYTPAINISVNQNHVGENSLLQVGYNRNALNVDANVTGNYIGGAVSLTGWKNLIFTDNVLRSPSVNLNLQAGNDMSGYQIDRNRYHGGIFAINDSTGARITGTDSTFSSWQSKNFDRAGTYSTALPEPSVHVRPNKYDVNRANIVVYNFGRAGNVNADLSSFLRSGDLYEIRDAQNYLGTPVLAGTFTGAPISLPMNLTAVQPYHGDFSGSYHTVQAVHTSPEFGVFIIKKTGTGTTPPPAATNGSCGTALNSCTEYSPILR